MVRVNFNLNEGMYINLQEYALDTRKTVNQMFAEMINEKVIEG